MPLTWHGADYVDKLPMTSMPLRPVDSLGYPGRTYKFFNGSTVYPFGYGLSYTNFTYTLTAPSRSLKLKRDKFQHCHSLKYKKGAYKPTCPSVKIDHLSCKDEVEFEVEVQNVGSRDGSDVVMVYSKPPEGIAETYIKQVVGFKRVFVAAGLSEKVKFKLNVCNSFGIVDYSGYRVLPSGGHTVVIGDDKLSFPFNVNFS